MEPERLAAVRAELERSRDLGFLGPGAVDGHIDHAIDFARLVDALLSESAIDEDRSGRVLDLGAGGGLPGLVLLTYLPAITVDLVDAHARRTSFLAAAVARLHVDGRALVLHGRAEVLGHDAGLRGAFDLVVARSFGPPAVTAECGAPFLRVGGHLVVSEPPDEACDRWPAEGLVSLGLRRRAASELPFVPRHRFAVLRSFAPVDEALPRRVGVPAKSPLFVPRET